MQGRCSAVQGEHYMPSSPIRGTRGGAATGRDTGPIRGKHSGRHYMPNSPIRGTRGGVATGRDTGPIRGKHSGRDKEPKEARSSGPVDRDKESRKDRAGLRI